MQNRSYAITDQVKQTRPVAQPLITKLYPMSSTGEDMASKKPIKNCFYIRKTPGKSKESLYISVTAPFPRNVFTACHGSDGNKVVVAGGKDRT